MGQNLGIGLSYAELATKEGAKAVVIADLRLTREAETLVESSKGVITFQKCDVTVWKDLQDLIDASLTEFGDVPDVYVAAAGVFEPARKLYCKLLLSRNIILEVLIDVNILDLLEFLGRPRTLGSRRLQTY